jgi:hypothetical protein
MPSFLGIDRSAYPGDSVMRLLRTEARVVWTGFYLAPAPSHPQAGWMLKRDFLRGLGYGLAPLYVGQQQRPGPGSHILTAAQGGIDARDAVRLARRAGFPDQSVLYLDIETGPRATTELFAYYRAWVDGVVDNNYTPGVYCSHLLARDFTTADNRAIPWIFHLKFRNGHTFPLPVSVPAPSESDFTRARMLQFAQAATIRFSARTLTPVDLDSSTTADPSIR